MEIESKSFMGSIVSIGADGQVNYTGKDRELGDRFKKMLIVAEANCFNKKSDWTQFDYLKFVKKLCKFEISTYNDTYDLMMSFLDMSLEDIKTRLTYLDSKLDLHLFDSERRTISVKSVDPFTGRKITTSKITFVEHEFSVEDIVSFLQSLNSKIKQHSYIILKNYESKADSSKSLDDKEADIKMLIDLLTKGEPKLCHIIEEKYFYWINSLPEDDMVYQYLKDRLADVINKNIRELKLKLCDYSIREVDIYKCNQSKDFYNKIALGHANSKDYWRQPKRF